MSFVYRPGHPRANSNGMVEKHLVAARSQDAPHIISDSLPDLRHPITGKRMDSKSAFRAITRAHGCVEVGNERQVDRRGISGMDSQSRKADIARAIQELGG